MANLSLAVISMTYTAVSGLNVHETKLEAKGRNAVFLTGGPLDSNTSLVEMRVWLYVSCPYKYVLYHTSRLTNQLSCFLFGRARVKISIGSPAILTWLVRRFSYSLLANTGRGRALGHDQWRS
jgi:hypothetical protein